MSTIETSAGVPISNSLLKNYFRNLVNQFFKILPMRENEEASLNIYIKSLQLELLGLKGFIPEIYDNPLYLTLLSILQYLIDNIDCPLSDVRREIFRAISICNKLKSVYTETEVS